MAGAVCCVCGRAVTAFAWCCADCAQEYHLNGYATWPEWAKFLKKDEERRRYRRDSAYGEIALSDLHAETARDIERQWYGECND